MVLDKSIENGKERRKKYRRGKAIDAQCRNHGSCAYYKSNRLHHVYKTMDAANDSMEDVYGVIHDAH